MPDHLIVPGGGPDDGGRLGEDLASHVVEDALEGLGAGLVEVQLEPTHFEHVLFLAHRPGLPVAGRARAACERVHADEEVVALGVEVSEPGLVARTGEVLGGGDALEDGALGRRRTARNGEERDAIRVPEEGPDVGDRVLGANGAFGASDKGCYRLAMATTGLTPKHSLPAILENAGNAAVFAAEEFFEAALSNEHTRRAYGRYVRLFLERCATDDLTLRQITPADAARFIRDLAPSVSTQKVALAALRRFFDLLVTRHVVILNPFASVRGPRQPADTGRTPEITVAQARQLLDSIDTTRLAGLRDRAVIGTLTYTGARVGALSQLRLQDLRDYGDHRTLCFREKGGKRREIPVRIDLDCWLADYLAAGRLADEPKGSPLLRPLDNRDRSRLVSRVLSPQLIRELVKRRLRDAGLPEILTPHSFRVMVVTDLLTQDVPIEDVQYLAGHSHPSTTQVYDRRAHKITRNIVERISV